MTSISISRDERPGQIVNTQSHTQHLSRVPQPYHRRGSSLLVAPDFSSSDTVSLNNETAESSDSSERGTEADDEKGPLLRSLPAPPLRARKGLRGHTSPLDLTPAISPFPSPPASVGQRHSYFAPEQNLPRHKSLTKDQSSQDEQYQKYRKRRRAETVRRCSESCLLATMGVISCTNRSRRRHLEPFHTELVTFFIVIFSIYIAYPFRRALNRLRAGLTVPSALQRGFHIPSRFDPGVLLYPIFLPLFIAASSTDQSPAIIPTNLLLGLSSLPHATIPVSSRFASQNLHWMISVAPLVVPKILGLPNRDILLEANGLREENLALMFPLHVSLFSTIESLTTTSLDPSEIQLLSSGLINLYLLAASPQAQIMKALLWVGGLCLFIFCQKPLSWEVTLARIPAWKFVRNRPSSTGIMGQVNRILKRIIPSKRTYLTSPGLYDSEDDDGSPSHYNPSKSTTRSRSTKLPFESRVSEPQSAVESGQTLESLLDSQSISKVRRSSTFSNFDRRSSVMSKRNKRAITSTSRSSMFLSLSYTQAIACKWLIALYTYVVVLLIVLVPVRQYVATRALAGRDPFGWAIGYLFGHISAFRLFLVINNLDTWVYLPLAPSQANIDMNLGWFEQYRTTIMGAANIRLALSIYCLLVLVCGLAAVLHLKSVVEVDTRRKVFHGVMVAMLLPTIPIDPCFVALALSLVLAIFLLLDLFRASQLPPISKPLTVFLAPYVDGRDHRGPVVVSHIFLLIGCAIPLWLSLASASRTGQEPWKGWDTNVRELGMISGVVCVGMGDAAASLIGRRYGKTKWYWGGGKSIEGSLAFMVAVTIGLTASSVWLILIGRSSIDYTGVPALVVKAAFAGTGASLLESTLTSANDNVVVPVGLWLLVRGLDI